MGMNVWVRGGLAVGVGLAATLVMAGGSAPTGAAVAPVSTVMISQAAGRSGVTPPSDTTLARAFSEQMDRLEAFGFSGVLLAGRGDHLVHASAHGLADREADRAFTTGTVVSLGSITKLYTAAAILRLVERGELSLGDTLGAFVPELPPDRSGITIEQLLTHRSGYGESQYGDDDPVTREILLEEARTLPLGDAPGSSVSYSNLGFSLLGIVLEEVADLPYEEALFRAVLEPVRAWETGYLRAGWREDRVAIGYRANGSRWGTIVERFSLPDGPGWILRANGGLQTTAFDVFRFVRAFVDGTLISSELASEAMSGRQGAPAQGLGWQTDDAPDGTPAVGHDGSNGFLTAAVRYLPEHDLTLFLAGNKASFSAIDVMPALLETAVGGDVRLAPAITPEPLDESAQRALAGVWEVGGGRLEVIDGGDHLRLDVVGQELLGHVLEITDMTRAALAEDTERSRSIVERAMEGDFAFPFLSGVWDGYRNSFGPIDSVEVMGSAPVWYASPRATWIRFHFEGREVTRVRRFHWSDGGDFYGFGGRVYPAPVSLRCAGTGRATCTAMHLVLPVLPLSLTFDGVGRATLQVGAESLEARKVTGGGGTR